MGRQCLCFILFRSPLKGDSFPHKSAVTPPPPDNGEKAGRKQQGDVNLNSLKGGEKKTALNALELTVAEDIVRL